MIKHERCWFQDKDGTYFRNCPLILDEQQELIELYRHTNPLRLRKLQQINALLAELKREWDQAWRDGVFRKEHLDHGDRVVQMAKFRDRYPDKPALWVLDEPDARSVERP